MIDPQNGGSRIGVVACEHLPYSEGVRSTEPLKASDSLGTATVRKK